MSEDETAKLLDTGAGSIQTFTRRIIEPMNLKEEDVDILDIAHALSNICRFTGHCTFFYSVAQHSILGAHALYKRTADAELCLAFLLHDASEAYICDIPRPIKRIPAFKPYLELESKIEDVIGRKFGVNIHQDIIKDMDKAMLATEKRDLMKNSPDRVWSYLPHPLLFSIGPMLPETAEAVFLTDFNRYTAESRDGEVAKSNGNPRSEWNERMRCFPSQPMIGR